MPKSGNCTFKAKSLSKAGADFMKASGKPGSGVWWIFRRERISGCKDFAAVLMYPWSKAAFGRLTFQKGPGSETLADWLSSRSMDTVTDWLAFRGLGRPGFAHIKKHSY